MGLMIVNCSVTTTMLVPLVGNGYDDSVTLILPIDRQGVNSYHFSSEQLCAFCLFMGSKVTAHGGMCPGMIIPRLVHEWNKASLEFALRGSSFEKSNEAEASV